MRKHEAILPAERGYGVSNLNPDPQFAAGATEAQQEAGTTNPDKNKKTAAKGPHAPGPWDPEVQGIHTVGAGRR